MLFCWSGQGIWILSKLTQNWRRYWRWHNGKYTMSAERKHCSTQIWIFNCKSEDWKLVVQYKRSFTEWVINFFKGKTTDGRLLTGSHLHREITWYSFSNMLQRDLLKLKIFWNTDRIRKSHEDMIGGTPNQLFQIPEYFTGLNCGGLHLNKTSTGKLAVNFI